MKHRKTCLGLLMALSASAAMAVAPKIAVGYDHMLLLKSDGTVWAWGGNGSGQLGTGNNLASATPVQVSGLSGVVDIVAREGGLSMALKADGTVWIWGANSDDLTGVATLGGVFNNIPVRVSNLGAMTSIAAAMDGASAFATDATGKVWTWGNNNNGELGDGKTARRPAPQAIAGLESAVQLAGTMAQASALRSDGAVFSWGYNATGDALRTGQSVGGNAAAAALANLPKLSAVVGVNSNTTGMFMGLDTQGTVLAWGDTNSGLLNCHQDIGNAAVSSLTQPYSPAGLTQIKQIAGGGLYALFLTQSGAVKACGYNADGQLGDGTTKGTTRDVPAKAGPVSVVGLPANVSYVAAGANASAAIAADGSVFTWGRAAGGLSGLGNLTTPNNPTPQAVAINAGALANAPASFAGTQTGALKSTSLSVGVAVAPAHVGQAGEVYLVIVLPTAQVLVFNAAGQLAPYDPAKPIEAFLKGALPARLPLALGSNVDLTGLGGTQIIVGYGLGTGAAANADMLGGGRFTSVLSLK
ncbi:MAG: hypothetical protein CFE44_08660 [Burkholderiales bacterium PBB4]|nr:MAG: hypothetical protein CFE44_08660 [Burkholderiales bacterium PBB4]